MPPSGRAGSAGMAVCAAGLERVLSTEAREALPDRRRGLRRRLRRARLRAARGDGAPRRRGRRLRRRGALRRARRGAPPPPAAALTSFSRWPGSSRGSSVSSTPRRWPRSPTARSRPRSTSRSGSSPCTGWALFLDYLIVIALSALFMPHYLGTALHVDALSRNPWDLFVAIAAIVVVAVARAFRRPAVHTFGIVVPVLDLVTQLLLVGVGFAVLFSPHALTIGTSLGSSPSWHAIAFAFPLAMLAYTGLETVANFAEEVRRPGRDLPRSLFSAVGLVVVIYVLIAVVGL